MRSKTAVVIVLFACCMLWSGPEMRAAESITNPLTGFSGDSTNPGTRTALSNAGFEVTDSVTTDKAILFSNFGVNFGSQVSGDGGRNYLRTIDTDYSSVSFEALVTFFMTDTNQQAYFGLGGGEVALYGTPDWSTQLSSVSVWIADVGVQLATFRTQDDTNEFQTVVGTPILGPHRVRMVFNSVAKTMLFSIDLNYSGIVFSADVIAPTVDVSTLYGPTGWPTEPARIFFGGDDQLYFQDLVVKVISPLIFENGFENP